MKKLAVAILSSFCFLQAETHITGDISGMQFDASGNPFIVEQDIVIPDGKKVAIKDGCVFLFKAFTGLQVQGQLSVEGTQKKPVVFTSINDGDFNHSSQQLANPFDWNGMLIARESGAVSLSNFAFRFSVYGIKSQNTNIKIDNGVFRQNGQFHFTINDKIQFVQDNLPYSYKGSDDNGGTVIPNVVNGNKTTSKKVRIIRYASLGVGIAGVIGGGVFGIVANNAYNDWVKRSKDPNFYESFHKDEDKFNTDLTITCIAGGVGLLGLAAFGISFAF
jgi:hypothetical protein